MTANPEALQLDTLNEIIQNENSKRQFYRPVYSIHKWWARRSGSQFRAILFNTLGNKTNLFQLGKSGDISRSSAFLNDADLSDKIVMDPFMGGGTTIVEANRLGAKTVGCDLNPVATWIVRESVKHVDVEDLTRRFKSLEAKAGKKIRKLYGTTCAVCKSNAVGMHYFWVRKINCLECSKSVLLFPRAMLNEGLSRTRPVSDENPATVICYRCHSLGKWNGSGKFTCPKCRLAFDPRSGVYRNGKYSCGSCRSEGNSLLGSINASNRFDAKLMAMEYWCPNCSERLYKSPDDQDMKLLMRIEQRVKRNRKNLIIPEQDILDGDSSARWKKYGMQKYSDVFNSRQILAFNMLLDEIARIEDTEQKNSLLTAFSNSLEYNNMMTPYNFKHRKMHHLFNYHALPVTMIPVESNFFGVKNFGAGTFANCFKRLVSAKQYCNRPFERIKNSDGKTMTVGFKSERIGANLVDDFAELERTERSCLLLNQNAGSLSQIPSKSVDSVVTDPPYFDNIHYSELSNFFYVWLHAILGSGLFVEKNVPVKNEAIVNQIMKKTTATYCRILTDVFSESNRILKDAGKLIFTFHHTNPEAWWTIISAICNSGFFIDNTYVINSEYKVNPHIRGKRALDSDIVLTCAKAKTALALKNSLKERRSTHARTKLDVLRTYLEETSILWFEKEVSEIEFITNLKKLLGSENICNTPILAGR